MTPVRVPVDATVFTVGQVFRVSNGHPFYEQDCPVCGEQNGPEPLIIVYVGTEPDDRRSEGLMDGAGVPVHAVCTSDNSASFDLIGPLKTLIEQWRNWSMPSDDDPGFPEDAGFAEGLALAAASVETLLKKIEGGEHSCVEPQYSSSL